MEGAMKGCKRKVQGKGASEMWSERCKLKIKNWKEYKESTVHVFECKDDGH